MTLNLYRRHRMTYEADELRRSWKNCSCPIYASGTLGLAFRRKNTGRSSWADAREVVSVWEAAGAESPPARNRATLHTREIRPHFHPGQEPTRIERVALNPGETKTVTMKLTPGSRRPMRI